MILTTVHGFYFSINTVFFHQWRYEELCKSIQAVIHGVLLDVEVEHRLKKDIDIFKWPVEYLKLLEHLDVDKMCGLATRRSIKGMNLNSLLKRNLYVWNCREIKGRQLWTHPFTVRKSIRISTVLFHENIKIIFIWILFTPHENH